MCAGVANPWIMSEILLHMLTANSLNNKKDLKLQSNFLQKTEKIYMFPYQERKCITNDGVQQLLLKQANSRINIADWHFQYAWSK